MTFMHLIICGFLGALAYFEVQKLTELVEKNYK